MARKNDRKPTAAKASRAEMIAEFRIEDDELPAFVEENAFRSGAYPYAEPLKSSVYDKELVRLQIELLKLLSDVKEKGRRVVVVFEGRDAAGKGGAIHRITQHLNPRSARVVALSRPTETERGQWYFQRYVTQMPTAGEIVLFDRSWYNRAVVEPVMGFCTAEETEAFYGQVQDFERLLVQDGVHLIKIWLHIGREMQMKRFHKRFHDPLKKWKLSPIDFKAQEKWTDFSNAIDTMLGRSDSAAAPWTVVLANDKRRTRLEVIRHILSRLDYADKSASLVKKVDKSIVLSAASFLGAGGEE